MLGKNGHTVIGFVIGKVRRRTVPKFFHEAAGNSISTYYTPEFYYDKRKNRVSIRKTIAENITPRAILNIIKSLRYIHSIVKEKAPDLVINFYEPLFGLYALTYKPKIKIVSIAHQFMIFAKGSYYEESSGGKLFLKLFSKICSSKSTLTIALSVYPWISKKTDFKVIPPLLRDDVLKLKPYNGGYLLCYILNIEFAKNLIYWHNDNKNVVIHVFWDNFVAAEGLTYNENLHFHHIDDKKFLKYLEGCTGLLTTAGFEAICEAAFLGKPVLMTPVHSEQRINAYEFSQFKFGIVSNELNPSLLIEYIMNEGAILKDTFNYQSRVISAKKILLDAINSL